jgi:hypothetical protein
MGESTFSKKLTNIILKGKSMNRYALFLVVISLLITLTGPAEAKIFEDDFESGNLALWTIDGRQLGINIAEVVDRNGSKMAHLYHQGFTEIDLTMENLVDFDENLFFSFDMEAQVTSPFSATDDHRYASGEASFAFLDSDQNSLGVVSFIKATSSYVFDYLNPRPDIELFRILNEQGLASYSCSVQNLLSYININEESISFVKLRFIAYGSEYNDLLTSNVWIDNVSVIPEPSSILLFGLGSLAFLRKRIA